MAENDIKLDPTISHGLEDRLGATIDERLAAREQREKSQDGPTHPERTEPIDDTEAPATSRSEG